MDRPIHFDYWYIFTPLVEIPVLSASTAVNLSAPAEMCVYTI
jgi:hypothetical protein